MVLRYYASNNKISSFIDLTPLEISLHTEYAWWIAANGHARDFEAAASHEASLLFIEYLMAGSPNLDEVKLEPSTRALPKADELPATPQENPLRFYTDDATLNPEINTRTLSAALRPHFVHWVQKGLLARDFLQAVQDSAACIIYDYLTYQSLGDSRLGGAKTSVEYLTQPYPRTCKPQSPLIRT